MISEQQVNTLLDQLDFNLVTFKNDLSVELINRQDLDFDNLSRGERNRLILGMSFVQRCVGELDQNINRCLMS